MAVHGQHPDTKKFEINKSQSKYKLKEKRSFKENGVVFGVLMHVDQL